ncbi:MAG TPA: class I SAM-dependent methyltransferase [Acidobacteriota bacterium]
MEDAYSRLDYRRLIAWPERIKREAPFLEGQLASAPSRRILDLGCGTGEHARFLAAQGYDVVGVDGSESMLAKACEQALPDNLRFVLGDLREIDRLVEGDFGAAICLGNTLPHLQREADLERLAGGLRRRLLPGGLLLLQILNYDKILSRRERALPLNFRPDADGELVFLRLMDPRPDGSVMFAPTTLRYRPDHDPPVELLASRRVALHGWRRDELSAILSRAGFQDLRAFGGFDGQPYQPLESPDLLLVAR